MHRWHQSLGCLDGVEQGRLARNQTTEAAPGSDLGFLGNPQALVKKTFVVSKLGEQLVHQG
jgi:hypothetical protein